MKMATGTEECDLVNKRKNEEMWKLLERMLENYDVVFCVGPEKKLVPGLKMILKVASPIFANLFEQWDELEEMGFADELEIPLPQFKAHAFELFVNLTILDSWTVESLERFELSIDQVLNLLPICRRFGMSSAAKNLEQFAQKCGKSIDFFLDTNEFLAVSQASLKVILSSDQLRMDERDAFNSACRWATFQCQSKGVEISGVNVVCLLGSDLLSTRFPLISAREFMIVIELLNLLTGAEAYDIYLFIKKEDTECLNFDGIQPSTLEAPVSTELVAQLNSLALSDNSETRKYLVPRRKLNPGVKEFEPIDQQKNQNLVEEGPLKEPTKPVQYPERTPLKRSELESLDPFKSRPFVKPNYDYAPFVNPRTPWQPWQWRFQPGLYDLQGKYRFSTIRRTQIVDGGSSFVCDGHWFHSMSLKTTHRIELLRLGFYGPIDADSIYDVTVEVIGCIGIYQSYSSGKIEKQVFARKGQIFYFTFDTPVTVWPATKSELFTQSFIRFSLKGPNTFSGEPKWSFAPSFLTIAWGNQVAEIQFSKN